MNTFTSKEIINHETKHVNEARQSMAKRPTGVPRSAFRMDNPTKTNSFQATVRQSNMKSKPVRVLTFGANGNPTDLWVWSESMKTVLDRIDLRSPNADEFLGRFEIVESNITE